MTPHGLTETRCHEPTHTLQAYSLGIDKVLFLFDNLANWENGGNATSHTVRVKVP